MDMIHYIKPFIKFKVPYITNIEDGVDEEYEALVIEKYGLKFYIINLYTSQRLIVKKFDELRVHGWIIDIFRLCGALDVYFKKTQKETDLYVALYKMFPEYKGKFVFSAAYGERSFKEFIDNFSKLCEKKYLSELMIQVSVIKS